MKRIFLIPVLALSGICLLNGCKAKESNKIDLTSTHTTAAPTTAPPKETMASTLEPTSAPETTEANLESGAAVNISTELKTYTADHISIQYPVISNMSDSAKQSSVNELLKTNATSIIKMFDLTDATVQISIKCNVISIDRNRMTASYTGSYTMQSGAYPTQIFYTNTVDLKEVKSLGLNDFTDAYTMAGYVMSEDCKFYNASASLEKELLDYRATQSIESYTALLSSADFPLKQDGDTFVFPESFSYTHQGTLYFSIPVPHALGDYALLSINMDGK